MTKQDSNCLIISAARVPVCVCVCVCVCVYKARSGLEGLVYPCSIGFASTILKVKRLWWLTEIGPSLDRELPPSDLTCRVPHLFWQS